MFISSTAEDLKAYRAAGRDAAISAGFLPRMMEYFAASGANPPLKECLEKVQGTDVLVVIVAHRYGWRPGGGPKSITWLECEQAVSDGREALAFLVDKDCAWPVELREAYRITAAIEQGNATPELLAEVQENIASLQEFKQRLESRGIRASFINPEDLRGKAETALREWRDRHREFAAAAAPRRASDPRKYLEDLRDLTGWIDIRGLQVGTGKAHRFRIEDLYIPLTTARGMEREAAPRGPVELEDLLSERRLVIVGDPGAGKTTFLRRIAFRLSDACLSGGEARFPILIRVAELAEHIRNCRQRAGQPCPTTEESPAWLAHFLNTRNTEFDWGLDEEFFRHKLEGDGSTLLLDGLDEAPSRIGRESIARLFENATQAYKQCRFVVTTRPQTYTGQSILAEFQTAQIEPLGTEAIEKFLEHWCQGLFPDSPQQARCHLAELSEALQARVEIRRMARNPVMLTALAVVHWNERRLPEQRADLYESILTWLARSREKRPERESAERCLTLLQQLALAMQDHPGGRQVQVSKGWAGGIVASEFLDQEEMDSGIIVSRSSEVQFWHLTFQEYLAARAIAGLADADQHQLLVAGNKIYRPDWREVALLLGGVLRVKQGPGKVDALVRALLEHLGERPSLADQARCVGLLGAVLRDLAPLDYRIADPRYKSALDSVLGIFEAQKAYSIDFQVRLEAAEALGQPGDPRLGKDNWIMIPAGEFLMGAQKKRASDPNYDPETYEQDESPVHRVYLDSCQIGKYPVTVQEYRRFVEEEGSQDERWWPAGGFGETTEPRKWENQILHPNRPVVNVSWFEAAAYCAWAKVRLPTEAEWERAARGTSGRKYPWGNEPVDPMRANYDEGKVGHATPVGLYPSGATPEGIRDLAGNVWEWVADWYGEKYYQESSDRNPQGPASGNTRVARGGSWIGSAWNLRAACRLRSEPGLRGIYLGFRCARDVSP